MTEKKLTIRADHHFDRGILSLGDAKLPSPLKRSEKVDWFRVIVDLERASYSHPHIAAAIGSARTTVRGWKQGATPKFDDGLRLIALWAQVTAKDHGAIPVIDRCDWRA